VPVTTGQGEVSLVVKDLLGREHIVAVPYYASPALLKRGLNDFSCEARFMRDNYSLKSNDYGDFLFSGTERRGFKEETMKIEADTGKGKCTFTLLAPKDLSGVPDLGNVICR